jgi:arginine N-succinyltransferase
MLVIRPVKSSDLDALVELAQLTGFGLTTLPRDRELLAERVRESEHSLSRECRRPRGEQYLFVMEDTATGTLAGTCGVASKVGGFDPFYAYRLNTVLHASEMLQVRKEIQTLELVLEHNGPAEVGSLFLRPEYRKDGNGRLLSLSRFLFMAEHPHRTEPVVIAEMRGVIDENGQSAFWDAVGRHFFDVDFPTADYLSMVNKRFIAELMPRYPIYVVLLPPEAQAVIGQTHADTRPALQMLLSEGFRYAGLVDIFEAGPVIICRCDQVRAIRESARAVVSEIVDELPLDEPVMFLANTRCDFRACRSPVQMLQDGSVRLPAASAQALQVELGEAIRYVTPRPGGTKLVGATASTAAASPPVSPASAETSAALLDEDKA